jgi:gliding motility associated protien GldN
MNLMFRYLLLYTLLFFGFFQETRSQVATSVNPSSLSPRKYEMDTINSIKKIREDDKMYQISVWRRIDLSEKYNLPLYGSGAAKKDGIVENIYKAVKLNLPIYSDSEFTKPLGITEFDSLFWFKADGDSILGPEQFTFLDIKEDFVFDRQHSQFKFDIKYIQLIMPSEVFGGGKQQNIAFIRYKDFIDYFKDNKEARWINFKNISEHKTYPQAFEQRLFRSYVTKYTNEADDTILNLLSSNTPADRLKMQAYLDGLAYEYKLLDLENSVWEW